MCGIVGVVEQGVDAAAMRIVLTRMRDTMLTRGPDDAGLECVAAGDSLIGLAHRRLSILDLSPRGRQPMCTADGSLSIVFNGEVFNFRELRAALEREGCREFRTDTDTEVILYAIRTWGLRAALRRLRGMYAFALHDRTDGSLSLVRDPLGVKPVYYYDDTGLFAFASEIKALLAHPRISPAIDYDALAHYLTFANAPAPLSLFAGVRKLPAGMLLRRERDGRVALERYWNAADVTVDTALDEQTCIERIRELLRQAVARRMVSDVPFGVFLSGGVDSSLNVALMAERMDRPVDTYSVGIAGDPANELGEARAIAQCFATRHHEVTIGDDEFLSFLAQMSHIQDEPLGDPVSVPLYYVSRLARQSGTTVVQVGEGSDEIFAGYGMYQRFVDWQRRAYDPYRRIPGIAKQALYQASRLLGNAALQDAGRRAAADEPLFIGNAVAFWDAEKADLLNRHLRPEDYASRYIRALSADLTTKDPLLAIINVELRNRLPELLLMRVDKVTMANSIEARVPFLDEDLVEFALSIPSALKVRNGQNKYILKRAAEGLIPAATIWRRKVGFCGSATNMLTPRILGHARAVIGDSPLMRELFQRRALDALFERHEHSPRFNSFKIWNLMTLALWHAAWFERKPLAVAA